MKLLPIKRTLEENQEFIEHPDCRENIQMSLAFYSIVGFEPPWISYYAEVDDQLVGAAGFKGKPKAGKVEVAYGTFPAYRHQGIGTEMCRQLVLLSRQTDPTVRIMARTLPENNESASILRKNGFTLLGTIWDEEDGDVYEWELMKDEVPHTVV
jgi:[ribosomal protein S5]-alanine N-acetyltransferase